MSDISVKMKTCCQARENVIDSGGTAILCLPSNLEWVGDQIKVPEAMSDHMKRESTLRNNKLLTVNDNNLSVLHFVQF